MIASDRRDAFRRLFEEAVLGREVTTGEADDDVFREIVDTKEALGPLIDRLERYLKKGGAKTVDRVGLTEIITVEVLVYRSGRYIAENLVPDNNLHRRAKQLGRAIKVLESPPPGLDIRDFLGPAPPHVRFGPPARIAAARRRMFEAIRYDDSLHSLRALHRAALPAPAKKPRHRPVKKTGDLLHALVDMLVGYWEETTSQRFHRNWRPDGAAANDGCRFVSAVAKCVDEDCVASLPRTTREVLERRRTKGIGPK